MVMSYSESNKNDMFKNKENTYLAHLNQEQAAAVKATEGAVLVLAGAGTGKTRVLTTRFAHIITSGLAEIYQVLTVTFTNKAAYEMRTRALAMLGPYEMREPNDLWLGTFHSICVRIIRRHAEVLGLQSNFTILNMDDVLRIIKQLALDQNIDSKKWSPRYIMGTIERWKDRALRPDQVTQTEGAGICSGKIHKIYQRYQERLKTLNACDFSDLILHCIYLFQNHPDILDRYHRRFRYILVDEYQDTNVAQYLWLCFLARGHGNICCVGDDDQSIYGWRGAEVNNILQFKQKFPDAQVIRLQQNYRSTGHILKAASGLISFNRHRLGKELWTDSGEGDVITVCHMWNGEEEAIWVGEHVEELQRQGVALSNLAILVRAGFQTRIFEERFLHLGVPYMVIGGARFYERMEIRDALAYFRVLQQPDDDLAFERIINKPKRKIGEKTINLLRNFGYQEGVGLYKAAAQLITTDRIPAGARKSLKELLEHFDRWRAHADGKSPAECAEQVLEESGYFTFWRMERTPDAQGRIESLKELIIAINEFDSLAVFLEHVALAIDLQQEGQIEAISVMTLHAAKGLEYDVVFLPGWEEGLFPHQRSLDEGGENSLEEERRLAYVGLTRAKRKVFISCAQNRRVHGHYINSAPSRFIKELPEDTLDLSPLDALSVSHNRHRYDAHSAAAPVKKRSYLKSASSHHISIADQVMHTTFGNGTVSKVEGGRLEVDFEGVGRKKIMANFVQKA